MEFKGTKFKVGQNIYTIYNGIKSCPIIKVGFKYLTVKLDYWGKAYNDNSLEQLRKIVDILGL